MGRRSNKSVQEILGQSESTDGFTTSVGGGHDDKELDRKIILATEGFTTTKYCELVLRDRTRLSKENALKVCDYIIDMKREINPSLNTIRTTIQFFSGLCKCVCVDHNNNKQKRFEEMTRDDILLFLDQCRKLEDDDPMHKWINTYNSKRSVLFRFFKWLQFRNVTGDPDKRQQLLNKGTYVFLSLVDAKMNLMQQSKECHWRRLKSRLLIVNKQFTMDIKCISR